MSKIKVAIHQPNLAPWLPYFYKMARVDYFVILDRVQFEKNGYQNRCKVWDKWWTKPVQNGKDYICNKKYADGQSLTDLNRRWIGVIKDTLSIRTQIIDQYPPLSILSSPGSCLPKDPTLKILSILKDVSRRYGDGKDVVYVTNPQAKDKYLDEQKLRDAGIEIEYCVVPRDLQVHVFEAFNRWGIMGTIKQLWRKN